MRAGSGLGAAGAAGFLDRLFHGVAGLTRALLNPAEQFVLLPGDILQVVVGELGPLLFEFALRNVPVALDFECVICSVCLQGLVGVVCSPSHPE